MIRVILEKYTMRDSLKRESGREVDWELTFIFIRSIL